MSAARAVERIRELEGERRDLAKQLTGLREELGSLRAEMSRLQERWRSDAAELRRLRVLNEERDEVKERLGRLSIPPARCGPEPYGARLDDGVCAS